MADVAEFRVAADAEFIVGKLSTPSKMPGFAYGIPAKYCPIGSTLAKIKGSVCASCYALKGRYVFPNVQAAQERRFKSLTHPRWVAAMAWLINRRKCRWFRWHDSGDLQGIWHLANICEVAKLCPDTYFWLPTREHGMVKYFNGVIPDNLVIRISGTMVDGPAPSKAKHTSTVVRTNPATCPAPQQGGKCGDCRQCWSPDIRNVAYEYH